MSFFNRIFSFTSKTKNISETPYFKGIDYGTSQYIDISSKDDILKAYQLTPTIRAIVDRYAELFSKAVIKEINSKTDEEIENSPFLTVIANPHPLYSENSFLKAIAKQWRLFGEVFIYVNRKNPGGLISEGDTFLILPAQNVEVILNDNVNIKEIKNIIDYISGYKLNLGDKEYYFDTTEIIYITENYNFDNNILLFKSIEQPINTILSAYDVRIALQRRKGGFGILTNNKQMPSGVVMNTDIESKQIEALQKEIKKYSFSAKDYNYIITNAQLQYQAITYPIKDMDLIEGVKQAKIDICDALNYPILGLNEMNGSTFANMETADVKLYTDAIIPLWELVETSFNSANLVVPTNYIWFDYEHIEALQSDKKVEFEATKLNDEIQLNRYKNGLIKKSELLSNIGLEVDNSEITDVYFYEESRSAQMLSTLIGVGGTQSLIEILKDPLLTPDQKFNALIILFNMSPEDARRMAGDSKVPKLPSTNINNNNDNDNDNE